MPQPAPAWDPQRYLAYADERGRPFLDLLARVRATAPAAVVDLGCGPGNLTRLLAERWPGAEVEGLDSSPEMIERAQRDAGSGAGTRVVFRVADLRDWRPARPVDVLVSHATLQWVEGHLDLLPHLVDQVAPGGWVALQVPANFDEPSHELRRELAAEAPYAALTRDVAVPASHDPQVYLRALRALGCSVDAWETTYLHVLDATRDPDPVFTWISGTGARPTLEALPPDLRARFTAQLKARLRAAYPTHDGSVVLPFRRVFAVAQVPPTPTRSV